VLAAQLRNRCSGFGLLQNPDDLAFRESGRLHAKFPVDPAARKFYLEHPLILGGTTAELPAKRADLLPWLVQQDPGTTLLDLLAFCTGALLDGIAGEERPHAINALAGALNLDMTGYWTPTRATYFDHVSKARIAEVVAAAVSPKAAADLDRMKKADAAAAAELRLAKVAWVPEIFTDREIPAAPSWESRDDDDEDEDGTDGADTAADAEETPEGEDAATHADAGHGTEHVNDTPPETCAAPASASEQSPWPFPTADSVSTGQSGALAA